MIVLVARYKVRPGAGETVLQALQKMSPLVKANEPGCALYQACRSVNDPDRLMLYEQYLDQQALDAHRETPYFKEIVEGVIVPLLEERQREFYILVVE